MGNAMINTFDHREYRQAIATTGDAVTLVSQCQKLLNEHQSIIAEQKTVIEHLQELIALQDERTAAQKALLHKRAADHRNNIRPQSRSSTYESVMTRVFEKWIDEVFDAGAANG